MGNPFEPDEPSYEEKRRAFKAARMADEKGNHLVRIIDERMAAVKAEQRKAFDSILKNFSAYLGKRFAEHKDGIAVAFEDMAADAMRRIDAELSLAIKDVRDVHAEQSKMAERLASRAAERAAIRLSVEISELRAEIEALRAERQLRAVR